MPTLIRSIILALLAALASVTASRAEAASAMLLPPSDPAGIGVGRARPAPGETVTLESLAERAVELRERLLAQPTDRSALAAEYEAALMQLSRKLAATGAPEAWARICLLKGLVVLAAIDPARAAACVKVAQPLVDALVPENLPSGRRLIGGLHVIFRGDAASRDIALTFDGGPAPATAPLLDVLKAEGVKATFFLLGCYAQKEPAVCRRIAAEGHVVGNHTMTHANWKGLARIPADAGSKDIAEGNRVISEITGVKPIELFRPPYGSGGERPEVCTRIARFHPYSIMWTIDSWDSLGADLPSQIRRVLGSKKLPGAIILCHDHSRQLVDLVKTIIPELRRKGFRFVTVPELIASGEQALLARRLAELCVDLQDRPASALVSTMTELGRRPGTGRLALEALDLAYVTARFVPDATVGAEALRSEIGRRFGAWARWALKPRPAVVE